MPSDAKTDREMADMSTNLLDDIREMQRLERAKRHTARSSDEFHDLAERIADQGRIVFQEAEAERQHGREDSPSPSEQAEQHLGDWTESQSH